MTATVVDLASRRQPDPAPAATCSCRPGRLCYPHRLTNLADLLRAHKARHEGELVIPLASLEDAVADALAVISSITDECLTSDTRSAR